MHTNLTCAFSGAFLLGGGFAAVMWGKLFVLPHTFCAKLFSLLSSIGAASPDMLGGSPGSQILLQLSSSRMGHPRDSNSYHAQHYWRLIQIRQCVPH